MEHNDETKSRQQAINLRAVRWAYEQDDLSTAERAVLMTFALHANERGYTWPGVERIAFTWRLHRATVRRAISSLFVRRRLCRTRKRVGRTGQVKVWRLPKTVWGSGLETVPFEKHENGRKRTQSGHKAVSKCTRTGNREQHILRMTHPSDAHSSPSAQSTHSSPKNGTSAPPTPLSEKGEDGYLIENKFFPSIEANRIAAGNENVLLSAKKAMRFADGSVKEVSR
jgi:hypothetical protein